MSYDNERLNEYLNDLVPERPAELREMEAYAQQHGFPIIGPAAGYFCYQIARLIQARRIFELGSGYGYSTAWFAKAIDENGGGELFHVVWDAQLSQRARQHLRRLGYDQIVRYLVSEAVDALRQTEGPFDLIFLDIEKKGYPQSIPVIERKLRQGGVLVVDNMIWSGRVFDEDNREASTEAIRATTRSLVESPHWLVSVVPIRDGLLLAYRQ